jgi:hypothetical protein
MTRLQSILFGLVVAALAFVAAPPPASPQAVAPGTAEPVSGTGTVIALVAVALTLLVALGIIIRLYDLRRQREQRAMELQAKLSDALFLEPALSTFAITPTVRAPMWPRAPLSVEISGAVPTGQHRDAAFQLVRRETSGLAQDLHLENHVVVDPRRFMHAA